MAAASRKTIPQVDALPIATMIDIGVTNPYAYLQAMMSTATALIKPNVQRAYPGPNNFPSQLPMRSRCRSYSMEAVIRQTLLDGTISNPIR